MPEHDLAEGRRSGLPRGPLKGPIDAMRTAYRERRDRAWAATERAGLRGRRSSATLYQVIDVSDARLPSMDLALRLLDESGVAVAPGIVFGPHAEGLIRISFAAEAEAIEEGIARIGAAVARWAAVGVPM